MKRIAIAVISAALLFGCKKAEEAPKREVEPISESEKERGVTACNIYVEHLCACAKSRPELTEKCDLQREARPEALGKALQAAAVSADPDVQWRLQITARRFIKNCIEEDNKLFAICPRK